MNPKTYNECSYLPGKDVKAAIEIDDGKFLIAVKDEEDFIIFDSQTERQSVLRNPTNDYRYLSMIKCPNYSFEEQPYVFLKSKDYISLIDVKNRKFCPLIRSLYELRMERQHVFEIVGFVAPLKHSLSNMRLEEKSTTESDEV